MEGGWGGGGGEAGGGGRGEAKAACAKSVHDAAKGTAAAKKKFLFI